MARSVLPLAVVAGVLATLPGCGLFDRPQRPAWREAAEKACMARRTVRASAYVQPAREIDGPGICGLTQPFRVAALSNGRVAINAQATLGCPVTEALEAWLDNVVQPAAQARFGQPVTQIDSMGGYGCRPINNQRGASLSEHSFGNALDVGGFRLADGRKITVVQGWTRGDEQEKAFLREAHSGACEYFTTVLGPGSNALHYNHLHVDLAMHGNTSTGPRRYCRPVIKEIAPPPRRDDLPDPPMLEPELEIARAMPGRGGADSRRLAAMSGSAGSFMPRGDAPIPSSSIGGVQRYGRLGLDVQAPAQAPMGAPMQLGARRPALASRGGMLRDDGAFVPPEEVGD
ncbi:MAG: hypothetical protein JWN93_1262 [Hyphomicrobiales bacterium]|nr:hypothetical protein [Hyphomicrobiales bacterium]